MQLRSQFQNLKLDAYSVKELRGELAYKAPHRQSVVDFFVKNVDRSAPVKMLGLPGIAWRAENEMVKHIPDASFVGLERDPNVFYESPHYMPGDQPKWSLLQLKADTCRHAAFNNKAKLLLTTAEGFFGTKDRWLSDKVAEDYTKFSCIWLDTWALCNKNLLKCLSQVQSRLNLGLKVVPFAVTLVGARDSFKGHDSRVEVITAALNYKAKDWTFVSSRNWVYKNEGRAAPMLNVMGKFHRWYR